MVPDEQLSRGRCDHCPRKAQETRSARRSRSAYPGKPRPAACNVNRFRQSAIDDCEWKTVGGGRLADCENAQRRRQRSGGFDPRRARSIPARQKHDRCAIANASSRTISTVALRLDFTERSRAVAFQRAPVPHADESARCAGTESYRGRVPETIPATDKSRV